MKKIIEGKLYNTDTAREIGSTSHGGQSFRDFRYYEETLYCKRTGEYFLFGNGGPMSKYAEYIDANNWRGGVKIMPLTLEEAKKWAERELDADAYEAEFGPVEENGSRVMMTISVSAAEADRIRKTAQAEGMSISAAIASRF